MAKAYGDDLRRKFLTAYENGDGTLEEPAEDFRVRLQLSLASRGVTPTIPRMRFPVSASIQSR